MKAVQIPEHIKEYIVIGCSEHEETEIPRYVFYSGEVSKPASSGILLQLLLDTVTWQYIHMLENPVMEEGDPPSLYDETKIIKLLVQMADPREIRETLAQLFWAKQRAFTITKERVIEGSH